MINYCASSDTEISEISWADTVLALTLSPGIRAMLVGGIALSAGLGASAQTRLLTGAGGDGSVSFQAPVPRLQVSLSHPVYEIAVDSKTGTPRMPTDVTASVKLLDWPEDQPAPATFTWRVALDWNYLPYPTHHDIARTAFESSSPFVVDFGNQIRGGTLTVTATTLWNGKPLLGKAIATVRGVNPPRTAILKAFPRTRFGLLASKVAEAESSMEQFTLAKGADPGGMPEVSRTNDVGIMQLNAPTGSVTSQDQIWDWRANVRRGMEELAEKRHTALIASRTTVPATVPTALLSEHLPEQNRSQNLVAFEALNFYRQFIGLKPLPLPNVPPLSDKPGTGVTPEDQDIDHLSVSQLEREALRRYNGGREYAYQIVPDPEIPNIRYAGWQIDPSRGGIQPRSGDLDYVRHVLRAHSGLTLPPPPRPAPAKKAAKKAAKTKAGKTRSGKGRKRDGKQTDTHNTNRGNHV